jgi:hypothetical protein
MNKTKFDNFNNYKVGDILIPSGVTKTLLNFNLSAILELKVVEIYDSGLKLELVKLLENNASYIYPLAYTYANNHSRWDVGRCFIIFNVSLKGLKHKIKEESYTIGF